MRIIPIINQLKDGCALLNNRVETAQSLTALSDEEIASDLPVAFVYAGKEVALKSETINASNQLSPVRVHVLVAAKNTDGIDEPLEDLRDQIKAALVGYQIDIQHDPMQFVEGDIVDVSKRVIWWKDTFESWSFLTS